MFFIISACVAYHGYFFIMALFFREIQLLLAYFIQYVLLRNSSVDMGEYNKFETAQFTKTHHVEPTFCLEQHAQKASRTSNRNIVKIKSTLCALILIMIRVTGIKMKEISRGCEEKFEIVTIVLYQQSQVSIETQQQQRKFTSFRLKQTTCLLSCL